MVEAEAQAPASRMESAASPACGRPRLSGGHRRDHCRSHRSAYRRGEIDGGRLAPCDQCDSRRRRSCRGPIASKAEVSTQSYGDARERERDGLLPTDVRFVFYELVQIAFIPKHSQSQSRKRRDGVRIRTPLMQCPATRQRGLVPWASTFDETRHLDVWRYAKTVADYLADTVKLARIDCWGDEPPPMTCA